MYQDFTTIEQAQLLLQMGVPRWTANMYHYLDGKTMTDHYCMTPEYCKEFDPKLYDRYYDPKHDPIWSVGRLIQIYNECVDFEKDDGASIVIFIQGESPIDQMMEMIGDKIGIMDFSKLDSATIEELSVEEDVEDAYKHRIIQALERSCGNRKAAAAKLGISERTLYRKIKEYGL